MWNTRRSKRQGGRPVTLESVMEKAREAAVALRRATELSYGRTPLQAALTNALLGHQLENGSFENDLLATACAVDA